MKNDQKRLAIRSGNVFESHSGVIAEDQAIVICDNRITWVCDGSSFEKEKYADLVICERSPLEDLSMLENPRNIAYVIKDRKIIIL
jgi:imidazolonepropionase-like amidohydrolase